MFFDFTPEQRLLGVAALSTVTLVVVYVLHLRFRYRAQARFDAAEWQSQSMLQQLQVLNDQQKATLAEHVEHVQRLEAELNTLKQALSEKAIELATNQTQATAQAQHHTEQIGRAHV